jgi:N-acetylglucosaminyldiphosphoundecaprenol N-acetyl-beta-D-mannosaminyltransferase
MLQIASDFRLSGASLAEAESIRASGADFVWVGISSPKQEYWMAEAAPVLGRGVLIGVGAAFDFHSGAIKRAPKWMRNNGLEWLHRLCSEPRRLWRRYLVLAPYFVFKVLVDLIPASRDRS